MSISVQNYRYWYWTEIDLCKLIIIVYCIYFVAVLALKLNITYSHLYLAARIVISQYIQHLYIYSSHRPYLSHRPHTVVTHTKRTQTLQINCKQLTYKFTQYTVNTINNNSM